uniref:Hypothetical chloroplast RF47 n=1 Tax=Nephroselmis pyriformis TaxID=156128 RepID=A0A8A2H8L8_9CHLO|nr:hypothetical chloroplast RF47 [Nephroselmis pyriformis]QSV37265.1 hypothetical chloroplast RF47 [Nephroselmis pyriformis]
MELVPSLRMLSSAFMILLVVSQGPQGEGLTQNLSESRFFANFKEVKFFIKLMNWSGVAFFLVVHLAAYILKLNDFQ